MTREEAVVKLKKLKEVMDLYTALNAVPSNKPYIDALEMSIKALENQKIGHWVKIAPYPMQTHEYACSECYHETHDNTENYCSECGARMVDKQGSEDNR